MHIIIGLFCNQECVMCKYHFYVAACKGEANVNYFACCSGGLFLSNPITTLAQGKPHEGRK